MTDTKKDKAARDALQAKMYRWLRNRAWGCDIPRGFPRVVEDDRTVLAESALDQAVIKAMKYRFRRKK